MGQQLPDQNARPLAVALVRGPDGRPCLDHPLSAYPAHIREAILAQMTEKEKIEYVNA